MILESNSNYAKYWLSKVRICAFTCPLGGVSKRESASVAIQAYWIRGGGDTYEIDCSE